MKQSTHLLWFALVFLVPLVASAQRLVLDDYAHSGSQYINNLVAADSSSAALPCWYSSICIAKRWTIFVQ